MVQGARAWLSDTYQRGASCVPRCIGLTIHSSRSRFAARLNSGVRRCKSFSQLHSQHCNSVRFGCICLSANCPLHYWLRSLHRARSSLASRVCRLRLASKFVNSAPSQATSVGIQRTVSQARPGTWSSASTAGSSGPSLSRLPSRLTIHSTGSRFAASVRVHHGVHTRRSLLLRCGSG
jgi:hypothetical protein